MDETTDISNKEQATVVIQCVENFTVHEEFLGLYSLPSIDSDVIVGMIKNVLIRMNLNINKLRGQCYNGASTMKGHRSGVSTQISQIEPRAVYTHCYGHSLNLAASDALKGSKLMKDALETVHEISKLIKYSPRQEGIFQKLKEDLILELEFYVQRDGLLGLNQLVVSSKTLMYFKIHGKRHLQL